MQQRHHRKGRESRSSSWARRCILADKRKRKESGKGRKGLSVCLVAMPKSGFEISQCKSWMCSSSSFSWQHVVSTLQHFIPHEKWKLLHTVSVDVLNSYTTHGDCDETSEKRGRIFNSGLEQNLRNFFFWISDWLLLTALGRTLWSVSFFRWNPNYNKLSGIWASAAKLWWLSRA